MNLLKMVPLDRVSDDWEDHTFPESLSPLVGRAKELNAASQLLRTGDVRLLTLVGPAGVGKTRLAAALAENLLEVFPDGARLIDLAPVRDPAAVPAAIALGLGVSSEVGAPGGDLRPASDLVSVLRRHLRPRAVLLILDNFEHLLPAATTVVELVAASPRSKVLVTSRERLRVRPEHLFSVPPLALPDLDRLPALEALAEVAAVDLFLRRARSSRSDMAITADNAAAIAEICVRLDGLPLAIELAAAQTNVLTPAAMLARLDQRLPLLRWPARDLPARHQTLRNAIAWSYDLLTDAERTLFRRLGAFVGGFSLQGAEAIAHSAHAEDLAFIAEGDRAAATATLQLVGSLVDKSLVRIAPSLGSEPRFIMLETIREFALEQLDASEEVDATRRAHASYFLALAERAAPELTGPDQAAWMARLEREHANLRAALDWLAEHGADDGELRLGIALRRFWRSRGYPRDGMSRLEGALSRAPSAPPALRMQALDGVGYFAQMLGADERAEALYGEALAIARSLGDERQVATILNNLGSMSTRNLDDAQASALLEESLAISRRQGDSWATALTLYKLGVLLQAQADMARAATLLRESLTLFRELGDRRSVAVVLTTLARPSTPGVPVSRGSRKLLEEGLLLCQELGDRGATSYAVELTAELLAQQVAPERIARLLGGVDGLREAMGVVRSRSADAGYTRAEAVARAALSEPAYVAAWEAGRALPLSAIIDDALSAVHQAAPSHERAPAPAAPEDATPPLTRREREVLGLLANGLSNQEIARELSIGERTARFHVTSILGKLGVRTRGQAVAVAMRQSLL